VPGVAAGKLPVIGTASRLLAVATPALRLILWRDSELGGLVDSGCGLDIDGSGPADSLDGAGDGAADVRSAGSDFSRAAREGRLVDSLVAEPSPGDPEWSLLAQTKPAIGSNTTSAATTAIAQ
jgi:hypothetical protein